MPSELSIFFFNEINRARPQVHALLLRVMAERSVAAFNRELRLPHLLVFADRNRVEREETFEISSAARDRFMMEIVIEAPPDDDDRRALVFDPRFHDTERLIDSLPAGVLAHRELDAIARADPAAASRPRRRCRTMRCACGAPRRRRREAGVRAVATSTLQRADAGRRQPARHEHAAARSARQCLARAAAARDARRRAGGVRRDHRRIGCACSRCTRCGASRSCRALLAGILAAVPAAVNRRAWQDGSVDEFYYRVRRAGARPLSGQPPQPARRAAASNIRGHAPLLAAPDARRIDLHASLRDPLGEWFVRVFSERKAVPVYVVADLSASMGYRGAAPQARRAGRLHASLAWSACRNGDAFGFIGCDEPCATNGCCRRRAHKGAGLDVSQPAARNTSRAGLHAGCWRRIASCGGSGRWCSSSRTFIWPWSRSTRCSVHWRTTSSCRSCCGTGSSSRHRATACAWWPIPERPAPAGVVATRIARTLGARASTA